MTRPVDADVRDRLTAERERNVVIEASAGTGKTTLLVERVRALLEAGVELERLCVVTFTEAAASELRSRLRTVPEAGPGISRAWIHTIHAFAGRILREYSHITGVDPDFRVCPSRFSPVETASRWDRYVTGLAGSDLDSAWSLIRTAGTAGLYGFVEKVLPYDWIDTAGIFGSSSDVVRRFLDRAIPVFESVLARCDDPADRLRMQVEKSLAHFETLTEDPAASDPLSSLVSASAGGKDSWGGKESKARVHGLVDPLSEEYAGNVAPVLGTAGAGPGIEGLVMPFIRELRSEWASDRSRLSYDDLLSVTLDLLSTPSHPLRSLLSERFDHVLIDEFQDTSGIQTSIFRSFLSEAGRLLPGRLSVVGDRKQSIYGWRNADIETYGEMVRELEDGGALSETIKVNFRSTGSIIRFVNRFGNALFAQQTDDEKAFGCDYSPLEPAPGAPAGVPVTVIDLPEPPDDRGGRMSGPRWSARCQAEMVTGRMKEIRSGEDPPGWGDFALLVRETGGLDQYIEVFEREGIPYTIQTTTDFRKIPDTADLREMLRCLVFPEDRKAWVHTLRSQFFGLSDVEISTALAGGTTGPGREGEGCPEAVAAADAMLLSLREAALALPLGDFLHVLMFETDILASIVASGYQTSRRLASFQLILEKALTGETGSIGDLLVEMDESRAPAVTREPASLPEDGEAVVVSTIHGAKGLAFRHVFVAGFPARRRGRKSGDLLTDRRSDRAAFSFGKGSATAHWPALLKREEARSTAESRRLIYVAVTRARDSLTLFRTPAGTCPSPAGLVWEAVDAARAADPECCVLERAGQELPAGADRRVQASLEPGSPPSPAAGPLFPVSPGPVEETGAEALGSLVHLVLEKIDFDDPEGWLEKHPVEIDGSRGELAQEARELALALFRTDLPAPLDGCDVVGREYPYIVVTPSGPKTRYVDLLLDAGDRLVVLDYKTDHVPGGDLAAASAGYMEVQRHYVRDLARAFGRPVEGYLVFLRAGAVFETARSG